MQKCAVVKVPFFIFLLRWDDLESQISESCGWMNGWSQGVHLIHKSLHWTGYSTWKRQTKIFSLTATIKICTPMQSDHIIKTHIQQVTFVLRPLQFRSTARSKHTFYLKKKKKKKKKNPEIWLCWLSWQIWHTPNSKLSPVSESSTHPLQNYVCFCFFRA